MKYFFGRIGPRKVSVTNLVGLTRSQAESILFIKGLNYSKSYTTTSTLSDDDKVISQSKSENITILYGDSITFVYYLYVNPTPPPPPPPVISYSSCYTYTTNSSSYTECSGTSNRTVTVFQERKRREVYSDGSFAGYDTSGCSDPASTYNYGSYQQTNNVCGYTTPPTITYSSCYTYAYNSSSYSECSGTFNRTVSYSQPLNRRDIYSDGVFAGYDNSATCPNGNYTYNYGTYQQNEGLCGYTRACVCNYSTTQTQSYHYAPECCPSGSQRAGSLSGTTVNSCCPNVSKSISGYQCKDYDVNNSASSNYYQCYSVGACSAPRNSDGSRVTCYA
jgi:hypothetical protein